MLDLTGCAGKQHPMLKPIIHPLWYIEAPISGERNLLHTNVQKLFMLDE